MHAKYLTCALFISTYQHKTQPIKTHILKLSFNFFFLFFILREFYRADKTYKLLVIERSCYQAEVLVSASFENGIEKIFFLYKGEQIKEKKHLVKIEGSQLGSCTTTSTIPCSTTQEQLELRR